MASALLVEPVALSDVVRCPCGANMTPVEYRDLDTHRRWLYWSCAKQHVTHALPLPEVCYPPHSAP